MGKLDVFVIIFDDDRTSYMPGDKVKGCLYLKVNKRFKINHMCLELNGRAKVQWTESKTINGQTKRLTYNSDETYIHKTWILESETHLEWGEKMYTFEFILPDNLPPSYSDQLGKISYEMNALIDRSWGVDKKCYNHFTVLPYLALNRCQGVNLPAVSNEVKYSCSTKPIQCKIAIPKTGFVCGEDIHFTVKIDNETSNDIEDCTVYLMKSVYYITPTGVNHVGSNFDRIKCPFVIFRNDFINWRGIIKIPYTDISISPINRCSIIEVSYRLVLEFNNLLFSTSQKIGIPVTIGTERNGQTVQSGSQNNNGMSSKANEDKNLGIIERYKSKLSPPYVAI